MARAPSVVMTTGTRFGAPAGCTHSEPDGVDVEARKWGKRSHSDGGSGEGAERSSSEYPDTPSGRCAEPHLPDSLLGAQEGGSLISTLNCGILLLQTSPNLWHLGFEVLGAGGGHTLRV